MIRENIYAKLFSLANTSAMLTANGGLFGTITRRPLNFDQYNSGDYPILGMVETTEKYIWPSGSATPPKAVLGAEFWIYINYGEDKNILPSTYLNNCIDALEAALNTSIIRPLQKQTLGNLVSDAYIEGEIKKAPGYTDGYGIGIIPITILVPA